MIRKIRESDSDEIANIYNHYILNSMATFEETPVDSIEMKKRIQALPNKFPWLVYVKDSEILGYSYAVEWKSRSAYKFTAETTVYIKPEVTGKGIGSLLYKEIIKQLSDMGFHAIIGGISLPNRISIRLHEKFGFKKVAQFQEVGYKFNKWVDVGYWELVIDK